MAPGQHVDEQQPTRHLLIAGTGRAGTSFLVRYLHGLGLDTHLSHVDDESRSWSEDASAGLEDLPVSGGRELPYVVKSPWTYQLVDQLIADSRLQFDAVVVPVRDLSEAAASRSVLSLQARHRAVPTLAAGDSPWRDWGDTPGGIVYSLHPLDQARVLAVGFHQVLQRFVNADVPVVLLAFPRFVEDGAYLFDKLRQHLPLEMSEQRALDVHAELADPAKVRIGRELSGSNTARESDDGLVLPSLEQLDRIALVREVGRLRESHATSQVAQRHAARDQQELTARIERLTLELEASVARERLARRRLARVQGSTSWRLILRLKSAVRRVPFGCALARRAARRLAVAPGRA